MNSTIKCLLYTHVHACVQIHADHAVTTINVYVIIVNILIDLIFKILFDDNG